MFQEHKKSKCDWNILNKGVGSVQDKLGNLGMGRLL